MAPAWKAEGTGILALALPGVASLLPLRPGMEPTALPAAQGGKGGPEKKSDLHQFPRPRPWPIISPMHPPALILFGHGARDPQWAEPLQRVRDAIQAREPERCVRLAFLEFMAPDLAQCVAELAAAGVTAIRLAPMFMAQSGHLKRDLPLQVAAVLERHPQLRIEIDGAIGEAPGVIEAMAAHLLAGKGA